MSALSSIPNAITTQSRFGRAERVWVGIGALVCLLSTWIFTGYRYEAWPQPGLLQYVAKFSGELQGDWFIGTPTPHWAIAHFLGLLPYEAVKVAVLILWALTVYTLFLGVLLLAIELGASVSSSVIGGLLIIPTGLGGVGSSEILLLGFYPTGPAFVLGLFSFLSLIKRRYSISGILAGLACVAHPHFGVLIVLALLPWVLAGSARQISVGLRFVVPCVLIGGPLVIGLIASHGDASMTPREVYEFLGVVRLPHHMTYSFFPVSEWLRTGMWISVIALCVLLSRANLTRAWQGIGAVTTTICLICAAGAISSASGELTMIFNAQTARLSAFIPLFGCVCAASTLTTLAPRFVGPLLAGVLVAALFVLEMPVAGPLSSSLSLAISALEALMVLMLIGGIVCVRFVARNPIASASAASFRIASATALLPIVIAVAVLWVQSPAKGVGASPAEASLRDIAKKANSETEPGQLVLASPSLDGLRLFSLRPDVVEFGSARLGRGDAEWRRRVEVLTGSPKILAVQPFGTDISARLAAIDDAYRKVMEHSAGPICEFHAKLIITDKATRLPRWLVPIYSNGVYVLSKPRNGLCQA